MNKFELLSPARDMESLRAAVLYGADAVYLGSDGFGLRANSGFSNNELTEAVAYAHEHGVKIYLACNVVANNSDIEAFAEYIQGLPPVNAVIVSDLGMLSVVKAHAPDLDIHISTQAGVMNYETANFLHKQGAKRIILARELSLSEIKEIRRNTPPDLELEAFVHGAMCVAFSGRCLLSAYLTERDANRGECSQPCRWEYSLTETTRPDEQFPIYENQHGTYILNSKDLCMLEHIPDLAEAGITSFKIEGRAKTAYYTAVVTNAYRAAIEAYKSGEPLPDWVKREAHCVSHRRYSTGFYYGAAEQYYENSGYIRDCDFVATVDSIHDCELEITVRNYFTIDDYIEMVIPGSTPERLVISEMRNSNGEAVTVANHAMEKLRVSAVGDAEVQNELPHPGVPPINTMLRRVNK